MPLSSYLLLSSHIENKSILISTKTPTNQLRCVQGIFIFPCVTLVLASRIIFVKLMGIVWNLNVIPINIYPSQCQFGYINYALTLFVIYKQFIQKVLILHKLAILSWDNWNLMCLRVFRCISSVRLNCIKVYRFWWVYETLALRRHAMNAMMYHE